MKNFLAGAGVLAVGMAAGFFSGVCFVIGCVQKDGIVYEDDNVVASGYTWADGDKLLYVTSKKKPTLEVDEG